MGSEPQVESRIIGSGRSRRGPVRGDAKCYVLMPFGDHRGYEGGRDQSQFVFDKIIEPAVLEVLGVKPIREDMRDDPGNIVQSIVDTLEDAEVIIADITGANPNVWWELGRRNAREPTPCIVMMQEPLDLPFDYKAQRTIPYSPWKVEAAQKRLRSALRKVVSPERQIPASTSLGQDRASAENFRALAQRFSPEEWRSIEAAINVEALIKEGACQDIDPALLHDSLIQCLHGSERSIHVMRVTAPSTESFYLSRKRGERWIEAQRSWGAEGDRGRERIRRIALVDPPKNLKKFNPWPLISEMDSVSDVRICTSGFLSVTSERHVASWDFGVFTGSGHEDVIFTFSSIVRGTIYAKHTGGEFHTTDRGLAEFFQRTFDSIWHRPGLLQESERLKVLFRDVHPH